MVTRGALPAGAVDWICAHVAPTGPATWIRTRPWATVATIPVTGGNVWFKACAPVQAFEPRLTAGLSSRWPELLPGLLAWDEHRAWLLLEDAGTVARDLGNPPELWLQALPAYAELQRGEAAHAEDHVSHGVPDLRVDKLAARFAELLSPDLPLRSEERSRLHAFEVTFGRWCAELDDAGIPASIQHDDLHHGNLYLRDRRPRILDWGDSSISHPFASLVVTFRFLERINRLDPADPWFAQLRDAYLEPWGGADHRETFDLAMRVGRFAHAIAWIRQRDAIGDAAERANFDEEYAVVLRRALALGV